MQAVGTMADNLLVVCEVSIMDQEPVSCRSLGEQSISTNYACWATVCIPWFLWQCRFILSLFCLIFHCQCEHIITGLTELLQYMWSIGQVALADPNHWQDYLLIFFIIFFLSIGLVVNEGKEVSRLMVKNEGKPVPLPVEWWRTLSFVLYLWF